MGYLNFDCFFLFENFIGFRIFDLEIINMYVCLLFEFGEVIFILMIFLLQFKGMGFFDLLLLIFIVVFLLVMLGFILIEE